MTRARHDARDSHPTPLCGDSGAETGDGGGGAKQTLSGARSITIALALPSRACLPNVRANKYERMAATEQDRTDAGYTAMETMRAAGIAPPRWAKAEATVQFRWPNAIRRDTSNYFAGMKPQWDSLVDSGVLLDDEWVIWHIPLPVIDRERPGVEITVWAVEGEGKE